MFRHVALGLSNDEIARSLGISLDTVKEHVQQILRKRAVIDRTQAAVWLDEKLRQVWERHPHFHFIPTELSFMAKINHGLSVIAAVLKEMQA